MPQHPCTPLIALSPVVYSRPHLSEIFTFHASKGNSANAVPAIPERRRPSSACGERGAGESRLISARREASALPCVRRSAEAPSPRGANLQSASSRARREHSTESEPAGSTTANGRTKDVRSRGTGEVEPRGDMMTRKGNNKTSANDDPTRKAEGGPDRPIQGAQTTRPATPRHGV